MSKEIQIEKMLNYLATKVSSNVRKIDNSFQLVDGFFQIPNLEYNERHNRSATINFDSKTIHWYAAYESHHNGSDYDIRRGMVSWSVLEDNFENIKRLSLGYMKENILQEENQKKQDWLNSTVNNKFSQLIDD